MKKQKTDGMLISFIILGLVILLFIAWPLVNTIISSEPSVLWQTILDWEVQYAVLLTFECSLIATVIAFICGVPLAYILARYTFPGKWLVEGIIDVPIVVPHTVVGIALLLVFGRKTFLGGAFRLVGIEFVSAVPGIVIAMLFVSLSFLINAAREGFESIDPRYEKIARTLGASHWQSFWKISFPLAWRGILSGMILMWARGLSEFGAVVILAYHPMIAPVLVFERFEAYGLKYSQPVAALLIFICLAIFILLRLTAYKRDKHA